jgi:hypothetical protein
MTDKNMQSLENNPNPWQFHVPAVAQPVRSEPVHYIDPSTNAILDNPLSFGSNVPLERTIPMRCMSRRKQRLARRT